MVFGKSYNGSYLKKNKLWFLMTLSVTKYLKISHKHVAIPEDPFDPASSCLEKLVSLLMSEL